MSLSSRVYFTGAEGIVTEVFYPTLDRVQNVDMQLVVVDAGRTFTPADAEERRQKSHDVTLLNKRALAWQVITVADNRKWKTTKRIFVDPTRQTLVQRVRFEVLEPGKTLRDFNVFVLSNPAINNSGGGAGSLGRNDNSRTLSFPLNPEGDTPRRVMLTASEPDSTSSALAISRPWKQVDGHPMVSSGFVGKNDGWTDLFGGTSDKTMDFHFDGAFNGNVAQMGWIDFGDSEQGSIDFDIVLSFGTNEANAMAEASATLDSDLSALEQTYISQWTEYTNGLDTLGGKADDQYYLAAMTLKCIEDKSNGAMIAGAGTPWGESNGDSNAGGYHLVWARDLFKFASALLGAGDVESAKTAVNYLFRVQMEANGRFPQNSMVDGRPYWDATQMDEISMSIILAWKLHEKQALDLAGLWPRIKLAAEYIARVGPRTEQDRWEEIGGYSPSTIAAEIAGLVCAAELADAANDSAAAALYRQKADEWRNNVANWTFTTTGFYGNRQYYIRITSNPDPNDSVELQLPNGSGKHDERAIVDGGFLELVRMGVMSPQDWTILETLPEYDAILRQDFPDGACAWFRYNFDGYGEGNEGQAFNGVDGRGRLWPIFTAERGIYDISRSANGADGQRYLRALKSFSTPAGLIPEQVWNWTTNVTGWEVITPERYTPGTATRSIQPLSWAMGEYMNLLAASVRGRNDAPSAVVRRYATDQPQTTATFTVRAEIEPGQEIYLVGDHPLLGAWIPTSAIKMSPRNYPEWNVTVSLPSKQTFRYKYLKRSAQGEPVWETGESRTLDTASQESVDRREIFQWEQ